MNMDFNIMSDLYRFSLSSEGRRQGTSMQNTFMKIFRRFTMRKIGLLLLLTLLTCSMWAMVNQPSGGAELSVAQAAGSTGLRQPVFYAYPTEIEFGGQQIHTQSHRTVTVRNTGTGSLQILSVSIPSTTPYYLTGLPAFPVNLGTNEDFEFQVFYAPTLAYAPVSDMETITIVADTGISTAGPMNHYVNLDGYGVDYTITVAPGTIDFGNGEINQDYYGAVSFGVSGGLNGASIQSVQFEEGVYFQYTNDPPLPHTVYNGSEAELNVKFNSGDYGYHEDIMIINTDCGTYSVPVYGSAWEPTLVADPEAVSFGNSCPLGEVATRNLVLTHSYNSGLSSLLIDNVALSGDPEFSLSNEIIVGGELITGLPHSLDSGGSMTFQIKFHPQEVAAKNAVFTVYFGDRMMQIPVTAFDVSAAQIEVSPPFIYHVLEPNFGTTGTLTIYNRGGEDLTFNIDVHNNESYVQFTPSSGTVAPDSELEVTYDIQPLGDYLGTLTYNVSINSNDPVNPVLTLPVAYASMTPVQDQAFVAYPTEGDLPLTVQFRMIPPLQGVRYYWDFDNNGTFDSLEPEPMHTYTTAGIYTVRLSLMLTTGATVQYVMPNYISVGYAGPAVVDDPLSTLEFFQGQTGGPYSLTQVFTAPDHAVLQYGVQGSEHISGTVDSWGNMYLNASPNWWGSEVITVSATDQYGNSASHQITVNVNHVNAAPTLSLPEDFYFIHRSTYLVDFSEYISDVDDDISDLGIALSMGYGDQNIQFAYHPINQPNIPGQHTVVFSSLTEGVQVARFVIEVNDFQRRATSSAEFNMHVLDHFEAAVSTDVNYQYTGQSVQFLDATLGNPNYWLWNFGDGNTSTEQNPVHIYQNAGEYDVSLTVGHDTANEEDSVTYMEYISMQGTCVLPGVLPPVWDPAGSPYNLFNGITFGDDGVFEIMDGVVINVFGDEPLTIEGTLIANNVTFAGPAAGGWTGLVFEGNNRNVSSLTGCTILDASSPLKIMGSSPNIQGLTINTTDSRDIRDAETAIFIGANSSAQIDSVEIDGYPEGIVIDNEAASGSTTPTLINIRVRNSTQTSRDGVLRGTGLSLKGSAEISAVEVDGYDTGIEVKNSRTDTTPTLINIRVRNSTQTSRNTPIKGTVGARISGNVSINNLDIAGYKTGIEVKSSQTPTATPTLINLRVRNSTQTSREEDNSLGLLIEEDAGPNIQDLEILDMPRGILIRGDDSSGRATPTLINIRVRNSTQTSRQSKYGLLIKEVKNVVINDAEFKNYYRGIQIKNSSQTVSTPTLINLRVRNSTQTSRAEGFGIDISGRVEAHLEDIEIEDYDHGLKYQGDPESRAVSTPTLINIRVRNSTQTSRAESYGMQLIDLDRVVLNDVEITEYQYGLELSNTQSYRAVSTPTLTNIRVRNSTQTSRFDNIGILLGNNVGGFIKESQIEQAKIGLMLADGNSTLIQPLKVFNCATGIKAASMAQAKTIHGHYIINEPDFISEHQDWTYTGFDLMGAGPWKIHNNTLVGMQHYLKAVDAQVAFLNNIGTSNPATDQPFILTGSDLDFNYNNIAIAGQHTGVGNFTAEPMFTDAAQRDYTLTPFSPCIDAGSPAEPLDSDGTISDVGAFTYLHQIAIRPSHRFVAPGTVVQFTNTSIGHEHPSTLVEWDLGNDGVVDATSRDWSYQFNQPGVYDLKLSMSTGILNDVREYTALVIVQEQQLQAPTGVQLSREEGNFHITWEPVLATTGGEPIEVPYYVVYASSNPHGFFDFVGYTAGGQTSYTDVQAGEASQRFYFVIGFSGTYREMMDFIEGNRTMRPGQAQTPALRPRKETPSSRTKQ